MNDGNHPPHVCMSMAEFIRQYCADQQLECTHLKNLYWGRDYCQKQLSGHCFQKSLC